MMSFYNMLARRWSRGVVLVLLLSGLSLPQLARAQVVFSQNSVFVDKGGTGISTRYKTALNTTPALDSLNGAGLGSYDQSAGMLLFQGGDFTTTETNGYVVGPVAVRYRVYNTNFAATAANPVFQDANVQQISNVSGIRTFRLINAGINLVTAANGVGSFVLEVFVQASGLQNGSTAFTVRDNNRGFNYKATFAVTSAASTTQWMGTTSADWFVAANWTNGVPDQTMDAIIADLSTGLALYPNISAGVEALGGTPARVRSLRFGGSSQSARAIGRLVAGELQVYGDFDNPYDSFVQRNNTLLNFKGTNQSITGGSNFGAVMIDGGGVKSLLHSMGMAGPLTFVSGQLVTGNDPVTSYVDLNNPTTFTDPITHVTTTTAGGSLQGETDANHLLGVVRTTRPSPPGTRTDFGNIGLVLTFAGNDPQGVLVTRTTGQYYSPTNQAGTSFSIGRIFGVRPGNPNTTSGGLSATLEFSYLDIETQSIGGISGQNIIESNLILFVSSTSGNNFSNLQKTTLNTGTNVLTKDGVTQFATFTLGDITNPLPVTLVAFQARRLGPDTRLSWSTASELNSQGFEIQVSNDGRQFRALGFVASALPNSTTAHSYVYTDAETGKTGTRYYRLRQLDFDGRQHFSPVVVVSFEAAAELATGRLNAYPNPFEDVVSFPLAGAAGSGQPLRVQLLDLSGRVLRQQLLDGSQNLLTMNNLATLPAGTYLARLTLADGSTQAARVQKR